MRRWLASASAALVLSGLVACTGSSPGSASGPVATIRIGELNIEYGGTVVDWDQTVAALEAMNLASPADVNQVVAYVEAVYLHRWATREMVGQSLVVAGARSDVTNKLLIIQAKAATLMLRFAQEFGLTPSARTRVDADPYRGGGSKPRKPSPFDGSNVWPAS